ncbi:MAG: glycoside hydrolase family 2 TIM barrel-domain containing protein [Gammaproteobacteria bacterium]
MVIATHNVLRALLLVSAGLLLMPSVSRADAIPVELRQTNQGWQLLRDGEPYFIRGAGGSGSLQQLAAAGANSVRTWGADDIDALLDEAHALGLSVTVGIWLGHERHGFDYNDDEQVREQLDRARETVLRYKDHPAVLLWGIGNEMEGYEDGDDPAIWAAVNDVAAMVKELDPAHPTMTVTADVGGGRIDGVNERSPAIDIHGINSYGGAMSVAERYRAGGGAKPYVLTEFGPPGTWEIPENEWGAPVEPTSTEKAAFYRRSYEQAVLGAPGLALGSYVFNWGYKMEATATWFGMFLPDGSRLGAVDVMTEMWSGEPPADLAPTVQPLILDGEHRVDPGDEVRVRAIVVDPEDTALSVRWALRRDSGDYAAGGDFRPMLPDVEGAVLESRADGALLRMPADPGAYRIFVYAHDEAGNAATANLPLFVNGEVRTPMPFYVYADNFEGMPWAPSGWMGSIDMLTLDGDHADNPHEGKASIKMRYAGEFGWVGVAWQHPPNNWGDQDGGYDLSGAKYLELWARGEYGGERIKLGVGLLGADRVHPDSGISSTESVELTSEWQRYRVPLKKIDLSSIKTGLVVTITGRKSPVTVYLDSIRFTR